MDYSKLLQESNLAARQTHRASHHGARTQVRQHYAPRC